MKQMYIIGRENQKIEEFQRRAAKMERAQVERAQSYFTNSNFFAIVSITMTEHLLALNY